MKCVTPILFLLLTTPLSHAGILRRGKVQMICHRTANRDIPENTLESLAYAARMGCNLVEVDVRQTLDGELVLHHDGYLERLSDGMGDVESTSFQELQMLDAGGWMAGRFAPMRIPRLTDALRLAREHGIGLALDIKEKGLAAQIFASLQREGMLERVTFGGDDGNAKELEALYPNANADPVVWIGPDCSATQVDQLHASGKFVVANFSANEHEMDLPAMRAAVAAGVDAINVDYPRLGADAIGDPVEGKVAALMQATQHGSTEQRTKAIYELSQYTGFPTSGVFLHALLDAEQRISRAAAVALVVSRPAVPLRTFLEVLNSSSTTARQNAAWALGMMHAPACKELITLLHSGSASELKEVLLAISRAPCDTPAEAVLPFLHSPVPTVRGAAALALAAHQPQMAAGPILDLLHQDEQRSAADYAIYVKAGKPKLSQAEIDPLVEQYREHMKLVHALELLTGKTALDALTSEAFRSAEDSSHVTSLLAGYGLWDRIAADPSAAIHALASPVVEVADRAEAVLIKAGPPVLPALWQALPASTSHVRERLIHILAWQCDAASLPALRALTPSSVQDSELIAWAIGKIELLRSATESEPLAH